jgi:hypothetical protein
MNQSALNDIQQALNAIRGEVARTDDETKWAALELMLGMSSSIVALAKKMTKPKTKTVKKTIAVPKTQIVKQPTIISKDYGDEHRNLSPISPIPPLSNQQTNDANVL